jgi:hypothetical protein
MSLDDDDDDGDDDDDMIQMVTLGTSSKLEIPSREHWLSTWIMTLYYEELVCYTDGSRMADRCGTRVCEVRPGGVGHVYVR